MKFKCTICGSCCKHLNINEQFLRDRGFPYSFDETGRCEFLKPDNTCLIYKNRPDACRVDIMQKVLELSDKELYKIMKKGCNLLMDIDNVPKEYRIK